MITVEVAVNDIAVFDEIKAACADEITFARIKKFNGAQDIIQLIVAVTSITLPFITKIILEHIRSKKSISVKFKGIEIKGISEKNITRILNSILNEEQQKQTD